MNSYLVLFPTVSQKHFQVFILGQPWIRITSSIIICPLIEVLFEWVQEEILLRRSLY